MTVEDNGRIQSVNKSTKHCDDMNSLSNIELMCGGEGERKGGRGREIESHHARTELP
jgi:hypothetical protein